jgi:hypothetical protein
MATVADYDVVSDAPTTLNAGDATNIALNFDSHINLGTRSVLSYMVDPGPSGATFTMTLPREGVADKVIVPSTTLPAQSGHVRQEVIDGNVLNSPDVLRIKVTAGSATVSDIVLMHQSDVP